jgi:hypothetical protein
LALVVGALTMAVAPIFARLADVGHPAFALGRLPAVFSSLAIFLEAIAAA